MVLIEYAEGITLTDEQWNDPLLQDFMVMVNHCVIYHNDIMSFEKEYHEQNSQLIRMTNVVAMTAIGDKSSIQEAMDKCGEQYLEVEAKAMEAMKKVLDSRVADNVKTFVDYAQYVIGGNFSAGYLTPRYNQIYE